MQRKWQSADKKGMWLSILLRPEIPPQQAPQLTLLTATVLADVLKYELKLQPLIKWPNDLLLNNKKVAGILTEMQAEQDQIQYVVIGVGLNINHEREDLPETFSYQATSLFQETGQTWSIQEIIQHFLNRFEQTYEEFMEVGFSPVKEKWENYGFKLGKKIKIKNIKEEREAIFQGIAEDGALLVRDDSGKLQKLYSGEIQWFE